VRTYAEVIGSGDPLLGDAAFGTRLAHETALALDPELGGSALASDGHPEAIEALAAEYAAIAVALGFPIELDAATYWLGPDRLAAAGRSGELTAMNRRSVEAVQAARRRFEGAEVFVAGVLGPRVDGYRPASAPAPDEAEAYHRPQAAALADAGVDALSGKTLSTAGEVLGMARALAATGCPYALGPVLDRRGHLPDGTPVEELVGRVDDEVDPAPLHWYVNCTAPGVVLEGLSAAAGRGDVGRIVGCKANGSSRPVADLDGAAVVHSDPPDEWAATMVELRRRFGLRLLGGCCGTDGRHLLALGLRLR